MIYFQPNYINALVTVCIVHHASVFLFSVSYFGDSYCRIDAVQDLLSFHLSLQFKTSRRSGLLLLAAGNRDYLYLELVNGRLQVKHTVKEPNNTVALTCNIFFFSSEYSYV